VGCSPWWEKLVNSRKYNKKEKEETPHPKVGIHRDNIKKDRRR
jgi:hypothetical protein